MIKKICLFLIISILICSTFISCNKKSELKTINLEPITITTEDATFQIDPRAEILMIACRLANITAFSVNTNDEYVNGIEKMYEKYKKHPLVKQLKKASHKFNGSALYELAIAEYISKDFTELTVTKSSMPEYLKKDFWGKVNLKKFIRNYNDFAVQSNFVRIWSYYEKHLKGSIIDVRDFYEKNKNILEAVKSFSYPNENIKIIICSTPILGNWVIGCPVFEENNQKIIKLYQAPKLNKEGDTDVYIFEEFLYGVNYSLLNKNWESISDKVRKIVNTVLKENKISVKYKDSAYKNQAASFLSSLLTIDYVKSCKQDDEAEEIIKYIRKYIMIEDTTQFETLFADYINNKNDYKSYEDFFENKIIPFINEY